MSNLMQFFSYDHLPEHLQEVSRPFAFLASKINHEGLNEKYVNPEREMALRKLLEAKDCAVRALLYKEANVCQHG